ncbi:MAG: nicotinamide-nucleotide adenylyltransferase [Thermoplasmatales archaeon]|nr:nicotinamide-nucleotide adenylyltransferase [Thermoplasmatales archaeon]
MRALIIGRFQPFHMGHAKLAENSKKYEIIFAIGSAYESFTFENPFTCSERYEMIVLAMKENKIKNYHIVPAPDINRYGLYAKHIEEIMPSFDIVISNNQLIKELFEREGYEVIEKPLFKRNIYQGKIIREKIAKKEKWENLVPKNVANFIKKIKGEERIRKIAEKGCNKFKSE